MLDSMTRSSPEIGTPLTSSRSTSLISSMISSRVSRSCASPWRVFKRLRIRCQSPVWPLPRAMRPAPEESAMRTPLRRHSVLGIGIGDAEAGENDPLQRFHLLRLVGLLVVVAQQMQDAVDQQVDRVVRHRLALLQCLARDSFARSEEHKSELQSLM